MPDQLSDAMALFVSETDSANPFVGGTFTLGDGPFTTTTLSVQDDETDFASLNQARSEAQGVGRQTGQLADGDGTVTHDGVASLDQVITLYDPNTGTTIWAARVRILVDDGSPGGGSELGRVYLFDSPIDPTVAYDVIDIEFAPGAAPERSFAYSDFSGGAMQGAAVCFAAGTLIRTETGLCPVEHLQIGDRVQTIDNGVKPILWRGHLQIGAAGLARDPRLRPVRIAEGVFGNARPLFVSQQHRIGFQGRFVKAKHLPEIAGLRARIAHGVRRIGYHHLLLERHEMLLANGVEAETLYPGPVTMQHMWAYGPGPEAHWLDGVRADPGDLCRPMLRRRDLRALSMEGAGAR